MRATPVRFAAIAAIGCALLLCKTGAGFTIPEHERSRRGKSRGETGADELADG
jgi:hypothetical protein